MFTQDKSPVYVLTRFVLEGSSADEWTEALDVMNTMRKNEPKKIADWYARLRDQGETTCPGVWTVLGEDKNSMTFERTTGACPPHEEQHALYRVMSGKKQVFTLIATRKGAMDETMRVNWLKVLASASFM